MGCPLKPLLANDLTGSIEETLVHEGKMTSFYKRCVDDTCTNYYAWHNICSYFSSSSQQLPLINEVHHKTKSNSLLPFLEMLHLNRAPQTETKVYTKPTNTGLFLQEPCRHTRHINDAWPYISLIIVFFWRMWPFDSSFLLAKICTTPYQIKSFIALLDLQPIPSNKKTTVRIVLPFKDQDSAGLVRKNWAERPASEDPHCRLTGFCYW